VCDVTGDSSSERKGKHVREIKVGLERRRRRRRTSIWAKNWFMKYKSKTDVVCGKCDVYTFSGGDVQECLLVIRIAGGMADIDSSVLLPDPGYCQSTGRIISVRRKRLIIFSCPVNGNSQWALVSAPEDDIVSNGYDLTCVIGMNFDSDFIPLSGQALLLNGRHDVMIAV
jgi:hypothetical protein